MKEYILIQCVYLIRIFVSAFCGAAIGYEREAHLKAAGIRTHSIVALGSCLMMIISKYGFYDVLNHSRISLDPSRIAASIVTAVGFLGAGMIFMNKKSITGLTTSAGIWATVGVGMAMGTGFYIIGIATTILLILIQTILHKNYRWLKKPVAEHITIQVKNNTEAISILKQNLLSYNIEFINIQAKKVENDYIHLKCFVKFPNSLKLSDIISLLQENPYIKSIEI